MGRSCTFRGGAARVVVVGGPLPRKRKRLTRREAILRSRESRWSYLGLAIGFTVGLVLFAIALLAE